MIKDHNSKIIAIGMLLAAVICISIGFASFESNLKIGTKAAVNPDPSQFNIKFSRVDGQDDEGPITASPSSNDIVSTNAVITNGASSSKISNMHAEFTGQNQYIVYEFYIHNAGSYKGYLNSITFDNIYNESVSKKCESKPGTSSEAMHDICSNISIEVKIGDNIYSGNDPKIDGEKIEIGEYKRGTIKISYAGGLEPDGDFDVTFGDITLNYDSIDK